MSHSAPLEGLGRPYQGYAYSYPHKSAYRQFEQPRPLQKLWSAADKARPFLYIHLPFCEMRCGFCNLFTTANPKEDLVDRYLAALTLEAQAFADKVGPGAAHRMAVGGGTPTYLEPEALAHVFDLAKTHFGADPASIPCSVETSPSTATSERLAVLAERGVDRMSIGIQSFDLAESRAMGRPQTPEVAEQALDTIRAAGAFGLNIDLIYGAANQTRESFIAAIRRALDWSPESLYLYPLYIRPRTGLDGRAEVWDEQRLDLYRTGRDYLRGQGYEQISMRHFRRADLHVSVANAEYICQEDGMIGMGAGARSYTCGSHYSRDFAVSRRGVLSIIEAYCVEDRDVFAHAHTGCDLSRGDSVRRYVMKSILNRDGLDCTRFTTRFGASPEACLPDLGRLVEAGCLEMRGTTLHPTDKGLEWSDAIGPFLYSSTVTERMDGFEVA